MKSRTVLAVVVLLVLIPASNAMGQCAYFPRPLTSTTTYSPGWVQVFLTFQPGNSPVCGSMTSMGTMGTTYVIPGAMGSASGTSVGCPIGAISAGFNRCPATATMNCRVLWGYAPTAGTGGICNFICSCGATIVPFTINNADGLPVELMKFDIDDTGDTGDSGDSGHFEQK